MFAPIAIICLRILWPFGITSGEEEWHASALPKWRIHGEMVVGLIHAQTDAMNYFVRKCYSGKTLSAAFGVNLHFGNLTAGHLTGLRKLLLVAGDVEANPGPNSDDKKCNTCGKFFGRTGDLNKHIRVVHEGLKEFSCDKCTYSTADKAHLERHQIIHNTQSTGNRGLDQKHSCGKCSYVSKRSHDLKRHLKKHLAPQEPLTKKLRVEESDSEIQKIVGTTLDQLVNRVANKEVTALKKGLRIVELDAHGLDPHVYLNGMITDVNDYVDHELNKKTGIKLQMVLSIQFHKELEPEKACIRGFRSNQLAIYRGSEFDVSEEFPRILAAVDKFIKQESGWVITQLLNLSLHMTTCKPLRGSTYKPLPKKLANKHAIVNIKNKDKCFVWSVLAKLYPTSKDPNRVSKYEEYEKQGVLNMKGIELPVTINPGIAKFEKQNNYAVNVYGYGEEEGIHPLRISAERNKEWVHLLFYDGHYTLIKDLNRLLHDETHHQHRLFFCPMCLIHRSTEQLLEQHMELCIRNEATKIILPKEETLKFTNTHKTLRQPLTVYADFECLTEEMDQPLDERNPARSFTERYQKHTPCGYGMVQSHGCCGDVEFSNLEVERCKDPVTRFLQSLMAAVIDYHNEPELAIVDFDAEKHASDKCHICGEQITEKKVKDHCHKCGKYRGPAHNHCNQSLRLNRDVVVVFHNLRRYDGHLIMRKIGEVAKLNGFEINVVAKAMEDYISFSLVHKKEDDGRHGQKDFGYNIKFIDSVQFLNNSLEGLVNNLQHDQFKAMKTEFSGEKLESLLRKGVYPYDYMNNWEKFEETELPPKVEFYSKLNEEHIIDSDYTHAKNVWSLFQLRNLGEYHDLYLKTDVLLLADVFESFRRFSLEKYGLDPCHYMTAPSLGWDACLKMTGVELELLKDPDMYMFCEAGIRGGISMISHRHAKANNPQMKDYDPAKPNSYIAYLDANNLYGWAMVQKMPVNEFQWVDNLDQEWDKINVDGEKGYFLQVDLEYPNELHDVHNDYLLAPETMEINGVSSYCEHLKQLMGLKSIPTKKLVPNLFKKTKYILHIRNLQLYLRLGMKLTKVHKALEFNQSAWMKDYIMFNTAMRAQATNDFDKDLLKLMNNAVFGKTMENVRKYRNIELVTTTARFEKLVANPRFKDSCRFTEDLVGISSLRPSTCLNKPIYCGLTVLDLSKVLMYEFHYDYIKPKYDQNARLLFTDTDSLCYWIQTEDIFADMKVDGDRFDFSGYPTDHPCYSTQNKKVIGKMKDEADSQIIEEFVGLRPKMYSIYGPKVEKKRAKGIKKRVVKHKISHADYVNTLRNEDSMFHEMKLMASNLHQMYSVRMNKRSLSAYDDKRWLLNSVESRAHGHYLNT